MAGYEENPTVAQAGAVTDRIWLRVELQWDWLGGPMPERPPLRRALGVGAAAAAG